MQFTTLLTVAASMALANAAVVNDRQADRKPLAKFKVFNHGEEDECKPADERWVVDLEPAANIRNECIPFSGPYTTFDFEFAQPGYFVGFFDASDCTENRNVTIYKNTPGCVPSDAGNAWLAYKLVKNGPSEA